VGLQKGLIAENWFSIDRLLGDSYVVLLRKKKILSLPSARERITYLTLFRVYSGITAPGGCGAIR
jgi:hypothetical protein